MMDTAAKIQLVSEFIRYTQRTERAIQDAMKVFGSGITDGELIESMEQIKYQYCQLVAEKIGDNWGLLYDNWTENNFKYQAKDLIDTIDEIQKNVRTIRTI